MPDRGEPHTTLAHLAEEEPLDIAKVFWSGRSQAVRLPKAYRFDVDEVRIRRSGTTVILEPIPRDWDWLDGVIGPLDEDFVEAVMTARISS